MARSNVMNSRRFIVAPNAEETTIVTEQLIALEGPMSALGQKRTYAVQWDHVRLTLSDGQLGSLNNERDRQSTFHCSAERR
jgi:hypothetical protein